MKVYKGVRENPEEKTCSEVVVTRTETVRPMPGIQHSDVVKELTPDRSLKLFNHSPTGFNWGYGGSGPAQLALAILLDYTNDSDKAIMFYQRFKTFVVAGWGDNWSITCVELDGWLRKFEKEDSQSVRSR